MTGLRRVAVLLVAIGCGSEDPAGDVSSRAGSDSAGEVEIGTGETRFEPLLDGVAVPMIAGAQGGFHVWLSIRARGFDEARLDVEITTEVTGTEPPTGLRTSMLPLTFEPTEDGAREFVGWPAVLDTTTCPLDAPVRLRVRVAEGNADGVLDEESEPFASDEREVELHGSDALWLPPSCTPAPD